MSPKSKAVKDCGSFIENGRRYLLTDVHAMEAADSFLNNDLMYIKIDHLGYTDFGHTAGGGPCFLQPRGSEYSKGMRFVYVRDDATGEFWSAPYEPVRQEPEKFEFAPGIRDITWRNVTRGIELEMRLVIPRDDTVELWTATTRNVSRRARRVSVYPFFPIGVLGWLINECSFDDKLGGILYKYFPYYVEVPDYYKNARLKNWVFCVGDRRPTSWEADMDEFLGSRLMDDPKQLHQPRLSKGYANFENGAAVFQYSYSLAPGQSAAVNLLFGPAKDMAEITHLKKKYLSTGGVDRALKTLDRFIAAHAPDLTVETPDGDFNCFVNHWLPRQAHWTGRTLRSSFSPCGRNAMTDVMGAVYIDPAKVREWCLKIWACQEKSGWMPHGLKLAEGAAITGINAIPHRDINVWGPHTIYTYVTETGDMSILDEKLGFSDAGGRATLYEHLCMGIDWLLRDRTPRGLSRLGQGDWCDPLNMAGHRMKGESVMLSQNLVWALDMWIPVCEAVGDAKRAARYRKEARNLRKAINRFAWDGKWYVRGTKDSGETFGSSKDKEGRVWLNPQSWAVIAGVADAKRRKALMAAVEKYLWTPSGPILNWPPYTHFDETIGKVTIKNAGIDENAAVYNSAVAWYSYAMYQARNADEAWRYLRVMLTGAGGNTICKSGQLPLYVSNFFKGPAVGRDAGESSHSPSTGTIAWFNHLVVAWLMGLRGEFGGLRVDPQLPSAWKTARAHRRFRGAEFDIVMKRSRSAKSVKVTLDGREVRGTLIPPQARGSKHKATVILPR